MLQDGLGKSSSRYGLIEKYAGDLELHSFAVFQHIFVNIGIWKPATLRIFHILVLYFFQQGSALGIKFLLQWHALDRFNPHFLRIIGFVLLPMHESAKEAA